MCRPACEESYALKGDLLIIYLFQGDDVFLCSDLIHEVEGCSIVVVEDDV